MQAKWPPPVFDTQTIMQAIRYMMARSDGIGPAEMTTALMDEFYPSDFVDRPNVEMNPVHLLEGYYRQLAQDNLRNELAERRANMQAARAKKDDRVKKAYDTGARVARAQAIASLLSMDSDVLLETQERWRAKNPDAGALMRQKPRGLGVDAP